MDDYGKVDEPGSKPRLTIQEVSRATANAAIGKWRREKKREKNK